MSSRGTAREGLYPRPLPWGDRTAHHVLAPPTWRCAILTLQALPNVTQDSCAVSLQCRLFQPVLVAEAALAIQLRGSEHGRIHFTGKVNHAQPITEA